MSQPELLKIKLYLSFGADPVSSTNFNAKL